MRERLRWHSKHGLVLIEDKNGPVHEGLALFRGESKRGDFATPQISSDIAAYQCPITGKEVDGRRAHRENLKRNNARVLEPGETREAPRRIEEAKTEALDRILGT